MSSCKEVTEEQVDANSAYILFYERQGLDKSHYMPDVTNKEPQTLDNDNDEFDKELRKFCIVQ
jgi:ubiquitin carboxyl-terminal hydrolase 6/32